MTKYFLDTSFIIGYTLETDTNYIKASKHENILLNEECYINNSVLNECMTLIYYKTNSIKAANELFLNMIDIFIILNEYEIKNYSIKALDLFNKTKVKLGFVDAGIINTMEHYNIKKLLTFDKEFKKIPNIETI